MQSPGREPRPLPTVCGYLPRYCNRAVAEQVLLMWLALLRRLPRQVQQFHRFERDGLTGAESQGKTLAVVGVGNIGAEVVKIGKAMDMEVLGVDIVERHDFVHYVEIDEALSRIEMGSYGYCEETSEPISISRLEARPIATLSIEAQERHERM